MDDTGKTLNTQYPLSFIKVKIHMTGCMGKRVFCDTGGNFEKCTF